MKICFIGLGSIGKKHIRNLTKILRQRDITFWIDALRVNNSLLEEDIQSLIQHIYQKFEELPSDYDIIFITNPTSMHYNTLLNIINKTKHVFVEKPVFAQQDVDLLALSPFKQGVNYVACPLRYHPITQFVREYIKGHQVFSVRSICSSYLPEWRKGVDYRQVYSALKEQGGGVSLDLIHEWDYIKYLFGEPKSVFNMKGKVSNLEISSDDISIYVARYEDKFIELHLDYFGRRSTREITLYTENEVLTGNFLLRTITIEGKEKKEIVLPEEDMYLNEMNHFIDLITKHLPNENTIEDGYQTLKIALNEGMMG